MATAPLRVAVTASTAAMLAATDQDIAAGRDRVLVAKRLVILDSTGEHVAAFMDGNGLTVSGPVTRKDLTTGKDVTRDFTASFTAGSLSISAVEGDGQLTFISDTGVALYEKKSDKLSKTFMGADGLVVAREGQRGSAVFDENGIELIDKNNVSRVRLGVAKLESKATGNTEENSLGSLVIFGPKGDVLYRVPR